MSRRKQAKPRFLQRQWEVQEERNCSGEINAAADANKDLTAAPAGKQVYERQLRSSEQTVAVKRSREDENLPLFVEKDDEKDDGAFRDIAGDQYRAVKSPRSDHDDRGSNSPQRQEMMMDDENSEIYKCETCNTIFNDLSEFMDHKNYECLSGLEMENTAIIRTKEGISSKSSNESEDAETVRSQSESSSETSDIFGPQNDPDYVDNQAYASSPRKALPYLCQFCTKSFSRLSYLKRHEQVHSDQMPFKCSYCNRLFKHKRSRDRHVKLHTNDRRYQCPQCDTAFVRSDHLKIHLKTHNNSKPFQCNLCNRGYTTSSALAAHLQASHKTPPTGGKDREFKCLKCSLTFALSIQLQEHLATHSSNATDALQSMQQCNYCAKIFPGKKTLQEHMETFHTNDKRNKCPLCAQSFLTAEQMQDHLSLHDEDDSQLCQSPSASGHKGEENAAATATEGPSAAGTKLKCPHCPKQHFPSLAVLNIHLNTMHSDKPLQTHTCHHCREVYPSLALLTEHLANVHHESKEQLDKQMLGYSFTCSYCLMEFENPASLQHHMQKVHSYSASSSPAEKHVCKHCLAEFTSFILLGEHQQFIHGDNIPLCCPHCNKTCSNYTSLQDHVQKVHNRSQLEKMKYPCPYCARQNLFDSIEQLQLHIEVEHSSERSTVDERVQNVMGDSSSPKGSHSSRVEYPEARNGSTPDPSSSNARNFKYGGQSKSLEYTCPECNAVCQTFETFQTHMQIHIERDRDMNKGRDDVISLDNIGGVGGEVEEYACPECKAVCKTFEAFQTHMRVHLKYPCQKCNIEFTSEEEVHKHLVEHFMVVSTEYGCHSCDKMFSKPDELQKHLFDIHAHHLYKCSLCKEVFDSKVTVQVHFAIKHSNVCKSYKCLQCGMVFRREEDLAVHVQLEHLKEQLMQYRCLFCQMSFTSDVEFQYHLTTHTREEFKCTVCADTFQQQQSLDQHMKTKHGSDGGTSSAWLSATLRPNSRSSSHPSEVYCLDSPSGDSLAESSTKQLKKFKCKACDSSFPTKLALDKHQSAVHGARKLGSDKIDKSMVPRSISPHGPFSCPTCPQIFQSNFELERHVATHGSWSIYQQSPLQQQQQQQEPDRPASRDGAATLCRVCRQPINSEPEFLSHAQQHHSQRQMAGGTPSKSISCVVCFSELTSMVDLQLHARYHIIQKTESSAPDSYHCSSCKRIFETKGKLIQKKDDAGQVYYNCVDCVKTALESHFQQQMPQPIFSKIFSEKGEKPRCLECRVKFETPAELQAHMDTAHHKTVAAEVPAKTFQCIKCQQTFATERDIHLHVATHVMQEGTQHPCNLCHQIMESPAKLQCHLIQHSFLDKDYQCPVCRAKFSCAIDIQVHVIEHGISARQHKCDKCPQTFFFEAELRNHSFSHPPQEQQPSSSLVATVAPKAPEELQCRDCKRTFSSATNLENHMKIHVAKESIFKCSLCPEVFSTSSAMQQHFFRSHNELEIEQKKKSYKCTKCVKVFPCMSNLQGHMRIHTHGKKFHCSICHKVFALSRNLTIHMRSHSGERPYQCPLCDKRFARKENRKVHLKSHSGFKQFLCPQCGKMFSRKCHVRDHMRTHLSLASPRHQCTQCEESFSLLKNLRRHMQRMHSSGQGESEEEGILPGGTAAATATQPIKSDDGQESPSTTFKEIEETTETKQDDENAVVDQTKIGE